jgi:SAM-dependent methyltransferase
MIEEALWMIKYCGKSVINSIPATCKRFVGWVRFWGSYYSYKKNAPVDRKPLVDDLYPCISDDTNITEIEPIYYYQDAWAFEKIVKTHPESHVDIGSHHKFVAFLSKVIPVTMVDIRPLSLPMNTIEFKKGSILDLPFEDGSIPSVSSLCVIEHIGLGRYGDPLDPFGSEKAINELKRIVRPGGDLYISVPVDVTNKIFYNAHRAFEEQYLQKLFKPFQVMETRYIYGKTFSDKYKPESGIGCYHLKNIK